MPTTLPKLIRQFSRKLAREGHTLSPEAGQAALNLHSHLRSFESQTAIQSPALRRMAVEAIDEFVRVRRG